MLANDCGGQRQKVTFAAHIRLAFTAQDVAHELADGRLDGFAGRAIDEDEHRARQRVGPADDIFLRRLNVGLPLLGREGERLDQRGAEGDAGVDDRVAILPDDSDRAPRVVVPRSAEPAEPIA